ncbi:acyl-CoA N-acyltransferase [Massariosphaeria phaeospora]|uniref:Acyl-CoA N-acyltransferase n=1 Tax=Massariosphaeria phaeospora TaxID=100035 RepID=A0A7C8I7Z4_9PLEO|nr:acyl-CoA N-acyltransferase [Massariosphaeria phaeospora]
MATPRSLDPHFHISTPRLTLSYFDPTQDSHCDFLAALYNNPEIKAANAGVATAVPDREAARRRIEQDTERQGETGYGHYLVSLTSTSDDTTGPTKPFAEHSHDLEKIGKVSLKVRKNPDAPSLPDMGFSFLPLYWGKGYATEASRALLDYFEREKGVTRVVGFCNPDNENSRNMFKRLGFRERGVRPVRGLTSDGREVRGLVWSRGVDGALEEYGL